MKAPRSEPKSSLSSSVSGKAAQLSATKGPRRLRPPSWTARATTSLPVPVSPWIKTVARLRCAFSTSCSTARIAGLRAAMRSTPLMRSSPESRGRKLSTRAIKFSRADAFLTTSSSTPDPKSSEASGSSLVSTRASTGRRLRRRRSQRASASASPRVRRSRQIARTPPSASALAASSRSAATHRDPCIPDSNESETMSILSFTSRLPTSSRAEQAACRLGTPGGAARGLPLRGCSPDSANARPKLRASA